MKLSEYLNFDDVIRVTERESRFVYEAQPIPEGVLVRLCSTAPSAIELITIDEFDARFEEFSSGYHTE